MAVDLNRWMHEKCSVDELNLRSFLLWPGVSLDLSSWMRGRPTLLDGDGDRQHLVALKSVRVMAGFSAMFLFRSKALLLRVGKLIHGLVCSSLHRLR